MDYSDLAKQEAALKALDFIQNGMHVGLGTGTTAVHFIRALAQKNLKIFAFCSSKKTEELARELNIPLLDEATTEFLDISVDGADEINSKFQMIKGGGGALLREKIMAQMSRERIVVVDSKKVVDELGAFPLPVEIIPFGWKSTVNRLETAGFFGALRGGQNTPFVTDSGNYIIDLQHLKPIVSPEKTHAALKQITGVVETGLFLGLADRVIIGYGDGNVEIR